MNAFWVLDVLCVVAIVAAAALVVFLRNLSGAVMALSALGTVMTLLFLVLAAPDVAEAEAVVGAIALPVLYLVAIGKVRADVPDSGQLGEDESQE
jgi:energy-converting hydrogenase B subunit D